MSVIALVSAKGGVGKTTIALGLASAGWHRGDRVLVVDADPLANATGVLDGRDPAGLGHPAPWPSRWGEHVHLADGTVLGPSFASLSTSYDIVLIDSPPALGEIPMSALNVADVAGIVTEPGFFALQGAHRPLEAIAQVRRSRNPALATPTIILNRLRSTSIEHVQADLGLRAAYGQLVYATVVPERFAVQQAQALRVPIHAWDSPAGRELAVIYDALYRHLVNLPGPTPQGTGSRAS
jgi:cellulose biosynthesis protein BcsQ